MRHHRGYPTVDVGDGGDALGRTIRIQWVLLGDLAVIIDVARANQTGLAEPWEVGAAGEERPTLAMSHRYRQP